MIFVFPKHLLLSILTVLFLIVGQSISARDNAAIPPTQKPYVINNIRYYPISSASGYSDIGIASWYGPDFHGRPTSNGERYNMYGITAAHKILPMNTMLLVQNLENGREIVVRVNDRGPFVRGRIIDLSFGSAKKLGVIKKGTAKVRIIALAPTRDGKFIQQPSFTEGEFFVQIGAFRQKHNALRLQKRFADAGHTAVIRQYQSKNEAFFRVQVYVGTLLQHALRAEQALLEKGYRGAFIVAR